MSSGTDNTNMQKSHETLIDDKWVLYDSNLPTKTMESYHKKYNIAKDKTMMSVRIIG